MLIEKYDGPATIKIIEQILTQSLGPEVTVTPSSLTEMMEMVLTLLHLRKVGIDFWMKSSSLAIRGITLAQRVQAEANFIALEDLTAKQKELITGAIELSIREIKALRKELLAEVAILVQMAPPDTKIN